MRVSRDVSAPDSMRCADGYMEFEGSCYKFVKKTGETAFSWYSARSYCSQDGADLASIQSQAENDFIWTQIEPRMKKRRAVELCL